MKKLADENAQNWHKKVYEALWVDKIMPKREIKMAPFELVYGIGAKISLPLELSAAKLQIVIKDSFFQNAPEKRVMYLMKLEEEREMLVDRITEHHNRVKKIFDMRARPRDSGFGSASMPNDSQIKKINGCLERRNERLKLVIPPEMIVEDVE
ncbi:uncharacterized protein LOC131876633 [Cryptomeria japonica]|uniref:uncharacterized protein LOC131876633 n=1 Tax=Cryptomeria japonica TaxID=3369 RepID=UPI0027D9ED6C|nr:uncharacterized protein LOC131876633 [Cryptomeria japonica]